MQQHRKRVNTYIELYKSKLSLKKADARLQSQLDELEDILDVYNISYARHQAEIQVISAQICPYCLVFAL